MPTTPEHSTEHRATRIWDVPVRLFHWLFALAFAGAWLATGDPYLHLHVFAGYVFAALLVFRLVWGFIGGRHARFTDFRYRPAVAWRYLRALGHGRAPHYAGHNPAGSWAIYLILGLATVLALTGMVTLAGQDQAGPLAGLLGFGTGAWARALHEIAAWTLTAVVGIHVAGVVIGSLAHRENLVTAMITGRKRASGEADTAAHHGVATALVVTLLAGAAFYFRDALTAPADKPYLPYTGPALADNATWRDECGSCHLAYHPNLLPARSWQRLLAGQHDHFGEDLALDAATVKTLTAFLTANAADRQQTEAAWYISRGTPPTAAPLRITDTSYWQHKHAGIPAARWTQAPVHGKSDCAACHLDASAGTFRDGAMRVPAPKPPMNTHAQLSKETSP